jgi:hypothetical protein
MPTADRVSAADPSDLESLEGTRGAVALRGPVDAGALPAASRTVVAGGK